LVRVALAQVALAQEGLALDRGRNRIAISLDRSRTACNHCKRGTPPSKSRMQPRVWEEQELALVELALALVELATALARVELAAAWVPKGYRNSLSLASTIADSGQHWQPTEKRPHSLGRFSEPPP